jgi:hypothetical protein
VTKPPTVTSRFRQAITGKKWVRQHLRIDAFGPTCRLRYGSDPADDHRTISVYDLRDVGVLAREDLSSLGCPTSNFDYGFMIRCDEDNRDIYFAVDGEEMRDAWVEAIGARRRHVHILEWERDFPEEFAFIVASPEITQQLTLALGQEIARRGRVSKAEDDVRRLVLDKEHRRVLRKLGKNLRRVPGARSAHSRHDSSLSVLEEDSLEPRSRASTVPSASSFSSFAGQASRGLYARATWAASVKDAFATRGTWIYKTSRRKVNRGPQSFADRLADRILTTWTRRYVRVRGEFLVYSVEEHHDIKGTIALEAIVDVGVLNATDLARLKSPHPYGFALRTQEHENVWCCETQAVRDAWVCALERRLLEDADREREEAEYEMRPRLGLMEMEAHARGELEIQAKAAFGALCADIRRQVEELWEGANESAAKAEEVRLVELRRSGTANLPLLIVPPPQLDVFCRSLARTAGRDATTALSAAIFDHDGLSLASSGETPLQYAALMAQLVDCASRLHPNSTRAGHRLVPDAVSIELDRKLFSVAPVSQGLLGFTLSLIRSQ